MMVGENINRKEKISVDNYSELIVGCATSGVGIAFGPLLLGLIGVPLTFKYLDKIRIAGSEVRLCVSLFGAIALAVYTAKRVRQNCEKKIHEKYEI